MSVVLELLRFAEDLVVGALGGSGVLLLSRKRRRPGKAETCTDISGHPHAFSKPCTSLRNPFCSDGRCRYHCQWFCKCPEVT
jgi:hypothetical protein